MALNINYLAMQRYDTEHRLLNNKTVCHWISIT